MTLEFAFANLSEFFWMEGHGSYVWSSYAITFVIIAILVVIPQLRRKQLIKAQHSKILRDNALQDDSSSSLSTNEVTNASGS